MTVEQYLALPDEKPYREYAYGEVIRKAMPDDDHAEITRLITQRINTWRDQGTGAERPEPRCRFDTERGPEYRLPDFAYWRPDEPRKDGVDLLPQGRGRGAVAGETRAEQREKRPTTAATVWTCAG